MYNYFQGSVDNLHDFLFSLIKCDAYIKANILIQIMWELWPEFKRRKLLAHKIMKKILKAGLYGDQKGKSNHKNNLHFSVLFKLYYFFKPVLWFCSLIHWNNFK